jgi:circadian clock protein KaiB
MIDPSATDRFEAALSRRDREQYVLCLYVVGATPASRRAITNLTRICEQYIAGRYTLDVVDIYQHPEIAEREQIFAAPTLIRLRPEPSARIVGDLSDEPKVLAGLDLRPDHA